jgi:Peptidase propeptide and YPEB domain
MTANSKRFTLAATVLVGLAAAGTAIAGSGEKAPAPAETPAAGGTRTVGPGEAETAGRRGGNAGESPDDDATEAAERVTNRSSSDRAAAAALEAAGGGSVTEVERADEGQSGYEVEVKRPYGSYAEVELNPGFGVVSVESDDD